MCSAAQCECKGMMMMVMQGVLTNEKTKLYHLHCTVNTKRKRKRTHTSYRQMKLIQSQ